MTTLNGIDLGLTPKAELMLERIMSAFGTGPITIISMLLEEAAHTSFSNMERKLERYTEQD